MDSQSHEWEIQLGQLHKTYDSIQAAYTIVNQQISLALTADVVLVAAAFQLKNALAVIAGGILLLVLSFVVYRVGQSIGALVAIALVYEDDLHIGQARSVATGFITGGRSASLIKHLHGLVSCKDKDQAEVLSWLRRSSRYNVFSSLRYPFRSKTHLIIVIMAIAHLIASYLLITNAGWSL